MTTTTKAIRLKGHRLETIAVNGGTFAECSCGASLRPEGRKGQNGRSVKLGIFVGLHKAAAIREAHEAHKAEVLASASS